MSIPTILLNDNSCHSLLLLSFLIPLVTPTVKGAIVIDQIESSKLCCLLSGSTISHNKLDRAKHYFIEPQKSKPQLLPNAQASLLNGECLCIPFLSSYSNHLVLPTPAIYAHNGKE